MRAALPSIGVHYKLPSPNCKTGYLSCPARGQSEHPVLGLPACSGVTYHARTRGVGFPRTCGDLNWDRQRLWACSTKDESGQIAAKEHFSPLSKLKIS